jgi:hypothetical protein
MHHAHCPTCGRKFKSIRDYPRVLVLSFERLPVPEAVDRHSREATAKWLARKRIEGHAADDGINRMPEIAKACVLAEVQEYFARLAKLAGQIVAPNDLKPRFEPSGRFKWAHPIPKTKLFLSLKEEKPADVREGLAVVEVHCAGPNLGSAGGPTLQALGAIGQIRYQGLLL